MVWTQLTKPLFKMIGKANLENVHSKDWEREPETRGGPCQGRFAWQCEDTEGDQQTLVSANGRPMQSAPGQRLCSATPISGGQSEANGRLQCRYLVLQR